MSALHRAAALAGHAVTASRVGKPQVLHRTWGESLKVSRGDQGPRAEAQTHIPDTATLNPKALGLRY